MLITSLEPEAFPTVDVLALYRLRWRIELGFKRLKSLIGLQGPPGRDERSARAYVLAHLLMILLLERSPSRSRTLLLGCRRLTPPGRLASPVPARRHASSNHHPRAHDRLPPALRGKPSATIPRAASTTKLSRTHPPILAPMGGHPGPGAPLGTLSQ
ncbi:MAG: transposase [Rhodospirillales bacterium]|nr:transposase [Rhodospirillales bacterium]